MKRVVYGTVVVCVNLFGGIQDKHLRPVRKHLENGVVLHVPLFFRDHELIVTGKAISENSYLLQVLSPIHPHNTIIEAKTTMRHVKQSMYINMALSKVIYAKNFGIIMNQDFGICLRINPCEKSHHINHRIKHFNWFLNIQQRMKSKHASILILGNIRLMDRANTIAHDGVDLRSLVHENNRTHALISEIPESSGRNGSPPSQGKTGRYPLLQHPQWIASFPVAFLEVMLYSITN